MSADTCKLHSDDIIGNYFTCEATKNVYFNLSFDNNFLVTGLNITGYQDLPGKLKSDIDTAFRSAYACFITDTRETVYQDWLEKIKYGMEIGKTYTLNGIRAIWGEGLVTWNAPEKGKYYYKIVFFCD